MVATFSVVFLAVATSSLLTNESSGLKEFFQVILLALLIQAQLSAQTGGTVNGAGTNFFIDKNSKGQISGSYSIFVLEPSGNIGFDHITKAQISKNNFKFSGIEDFDGICGTSGTGQPTTMSMSGQCGLGVTCTLHRRQRSKSNHLWCKCGLLYIMEDFREFSWCWPLLRHSV